jgi:hypothetical protein
MSERVPVPTIMAATRVTGIPVTYSLLTDNGEVYIMYASHQIELLRTEVSYHPEPHVRLTSTLDGTSGLSAKHSSPAKRR